MANIYLKYDVFQIAGGFEVVVGDCSKISKISNMHGELRLSFGECNIWKV